MTSTDCAGPRPDLGAQQGWLSGTTRSGRYAICLAYWSNSPSQIVVVSLSLPDLFSWATRLKFIGTVSEAVSERVVIDTGGSQRHAEVIGDATPVLSLGRSNRWPFKRQIGIWVSRCGRFLQRNWSLIHIPLCVAWRRFPCPKSISCWQKSPQLVTGSLIRSDQSHRASGWTAKLGRIDQLDSQFDSTASQRRTD